MKCKICGDPIKRCPRKETNNWCHTWHHNHIPKYQIEESLKNKLIETTEKILKFGTKLISTICKTIHEDIKRNAEENRRRTWELRTIEENSAAIGHGLNRGNYIAEMQRKNRGRAEREMNNFFR